MLMPWGYRSGHPLRRAPLRASRRIVLCNSRLRLPEGAKDGDLFQEGWPPLRVAMDAEQRQRRQPRRHWQGPLCPGVKLLEDPLLRAILPQPQLVTEEDAALPVCAQDGGRLTRKELKDDHAPRVDLARLRDDSSFDILWVHITKRPGDVVTTARQLATAWHAGQPEVTDLGSTVGTEEDVLALDVTVEYLRTMFVQMCQAAGDVHRCPQPFVPEKGRSIHLQLSVEVTPAQQLVDQRTALRGAASPSPPATAAGLLLWARNAFLSRKTQQEDHVRVPAAREEPDFMLETAVHGSIQDFDGCSSALSEIPTVNCTACTSTQSTGCAHAGR